MLSTPLSKILRTTSKHLKRLELLDVKTLEDFLLFFPRSYEDLSTFTPIAELRTDRVNIIKARLTNVFHNKTRQGKTLTRAMLEDETGKVEAVWFNQSFLREVLINGKTMIFAGKARFKMGKISLQSPVYEELRSELIHMGRIVPVYHQTEGITSKWIREKLKPLLDKYRNLLAEYLPESLRQEYRLMDYAEAVYEAHFPTTQEKLRKAQYRLSFDELFLLQLKALQKKWQWQQIASEHQKQIVRHPELTDFIKKLPFTLTNAQQRSLEEIMIDLAQPYPMSRLLQGDVGSGKTAVAAAALFNVMKAGYQGVLMAPTEILARQHYQTLFKLLQPYGFSIQFLAGSTPQSVKKEVYSGLATGTVDVVVGTHALVQEGVEFHRLGLAIIDEQHRFGVRQREILKSKGHPHLLNLSATPIPRTLAMTIYGDQDLSIIDEMPKGRREIITRVVPENKRIDAYRWVEDQVKKGRQAFIICPLIDESDALELKAAIREYEHLQQNVFPQLRLGLLHGKMKAQEKDSIMAAFQANDINILVSTSVVEVGIDVPNATIMLIEGADRFGLSQLHQFRGRVGRGEHQSYCFLFTESNSRTSRFRLEAMVQHASGFKLAEIDLELRGPGEIYGVRQSGIPDLKMASLTDSRTIALAREAAQKLIQADPELIQYPQIRSKLQEWDGEVYVKD